MPSYLLTRKNEFDIINASVTEWYQISRCRIHIDPNTGEWICPPIANALSIAGLLLLSEYIEGRRKYLLPWTAQSELFQQSKQLGSGVNTSRCIYWSSQMTIDEIT
jgi:hypothetical protein